MKRTTLNFLFNGRGEILMIEKKRGMGAGKWNFPGGKIAEGESSENAARRETLEETGVVAHRLEPMGVIEFVFESGGPSWDNRCELFRCFDFAGEPVGEVEECRSFWWPIDAIPFDRLWPDDRYWLPEILAGRSVHRRYRFSAGNELLDEEMIDAG